MKNYLEKHQKQQLNKSFSQLLPTPKVKSKSNNTSRRKSFNYKALQVTKDLFANTPSTSGIQKQSKTAKMSKKSKRRVSTSNVEEWYCPASKSDAKLDIHCCGICKTWFHE